jgi:hypothetical protein
LSRFIKKLARDYSRNFTASPRAHHNGLAMLDKRKSQRRKMVLPVKVFIDQATHLAHTMDITDSGARLGALRTELKPGMIVSLQRGSQRAKFQIAWVRQLAPNELQAGIESVQPQNSFWGVDLSPREPEVKKETQQAMLTILLGRAKSATRK